MTLTWDLQGPGQEISEAVLLGRLTDKNLCILCPRRGSWARFQGRTSDPHVTQC